MLYEIYCEQFHKKKISFNQGLNVVLGTSKADNSIGKSTFLLIVDFVFGGNTYANASDINNAIGKHDIYFAFKFNNKIYYFCRNNIENNIVWSCDQEYKKIKDIDLKEFCNWLQDMYKICLPDLTFREAVGRYIRVYGKKNCKEDRPLDYMSSEKAETACYALLKLFNAFLPLKELKEQAKKSTEKYNIYTKAQNLDLVDKITKMQYKKNQAKITELTKELEDLSSGIEQGLLDLDMVATEEAIRLKDILSRAQRAKAKLQGKYNIIDENGNYQFSATCNSFEDLQKYFPTVNIISIKEIEEFHNKIAEIFKQELKEEKIRIKKELDEYNGIINNCKDKLQELIKNPNLSKMILSRHADLLKEREILIKQNKVYEQNNNLKITKDDDQKRLLQLKNKQFSIIETLINQKMNTFNNNIYNGACNAPTLIFTDKNYNFFTPNDTGTGIACKGLVVFDLSILDLTKLCVLVHDSVILKQISNFAIEKILNLYIVSQKQVIIAFDKQDSYSKNTQQLLEKNAILKLAPNGEELFGRSWG